MWQPGGDSELCASIPLATPGSSRTVTLRAWKTWATRLGLANPGRVAGPAFTALAAEMLAQRRGWRVLRLRSSAPAVSTWMWNWRHGAVLELELEAAHSHHLAPGVLGLAAICRPAEAESIAEVVASCASAISEAAIVVDGSTAVDVGRVVSAIRRRAGTSLPVKVVARTLGGDFSAQRNYAQQLLSTRWTLALDADERPTPALLDAVGWVVQDCEQKGRVVCGVGRRNFVDGELTECYPDFQFRLLRTHIPWVGTVHEVPAPCGRRGRRVWTFPVAGIDHFIDGARLGTRRRQYEQLSQGAGQTEGQRLLEVRSSAQGNAW